LALYDGAERRKRPVGAIISTSFSKLPRVLVASLLFGLVTFWPLLLLVAAPLLLLASSHTGSGVFLAIPILALFAIAWVYIALIRFALTPFVALFEQDVPVLKTLGRSKHLLQKGGQWFLLKGLLLLILIAIIAAIATGTTVQKLNQSDNLGLNIFMVVVDMFANSVLVMLYRNRKIVRG
jgi:hypothetical protein